MLTNDYTKNSSATEVVTESGAVYLFAYIQGKLKVKRQGKKDNKNLEWVDLYIYPSIEIGEPLTLIIMKDSSRIEDAVIRWTTPVQSIGTGRKVT